MSTDLEVRVVRQKEAVEKPDHPHLAGAVKADLQILPASVAAIPGEA